MQLITVTDIFGKTKCFDKIINEISPLYTSVEIVDPYHGKEIDFKNEQEAYQYFQDEMGLDKYTEKLSKKLEGKENEKTVLLGFSIGASAIWVLSEGQILSAETKGICFYSSQLRYYLDINPKFLIDLYFSKSEPSYNVEEVIESLSDKSYVKCFRTPYYHGFMNEKSKNFNVQGYRQYIKYIKQ